MPGRVAALVRATGLAGWDRSDSQGRTAPETTTSPYRLMTNGATAKPNCGLDSRQLPSLEPLPNAAGAEDGRQVVAALGIGVGNSAAGPRSALSRRSRYRRDRNNLGHAAYDAIT